MFSELQDHGWCCDCEDQCIQCTLNQECRETKQLLAASLQVDGTLAFLLTIKMAYKESSFEPPADLLATVKKATWNYNKEHHQRCF